MPEQSTSSPSDQSWQQTVFAQLRTAEDWMRAGDLFDDVETVIPLHHAMRYCERKKTPERSPGGARWKLFVFGISQMGGVWERVGRNHQPGERLRLKTYGECPACGEALRKASWSNQTTLECKSCGVAVNRSAWSEKASQMKKEPAVVIASKERVSQPHPLIGYRVTKRDERGAIEMRNGMVVEVVPTNHMGFGDIAVIAYRDRARVELVSLAELGSKRELWVIMPASSSDIAEAAE